MKNLLIKAQKVMRAHQSHQLLDLGIFEKYFNGYFSNKSPGTMQRKSIASPKIMSKLSPINTLVARNNLNLNPTSQKALL